MVYSESAKYENWRRCTLWLKSRVSGKKGKNAKTQINNDLSLCFQVKTTQQNGAMAIYLSLYLCMRASWQTLLRSNNSDRETTTGSETRRPVLRQRIFSALRQHHMDFLQAALCGKRRGWEVASAVWSSTSKGSAGRVDIPRFTLAQNVRRTSSGVELAESRRERGERGGYVKEGGGGGGGSYGHTPAAGSSCRTGREEAPGPWSRVSAHRPRSPGHTRCPTKDRLLQGEDNGHVKEKVAKSLLCAQ